MQAEDYEDLHILEDNFWWFKGMREITASLLDPFCPPTGQNRFVLDAGCGAGGNLSWLKRYAGEAPVIGMDIAPEALAFCHRRNHDRLVRASVTNLAFAEAAFDLVTSFDVLVQLRGEGADGAIREMYRVLKPNGLAFVRVAAYQWMRSSHDEALGTQRRYQLNEMVEKMRRAGFRILRITYANTLLFPLAIIRRHLVKRIGVGHSGSDVKPLPPKLRWLDGILIGALRSEARFLKHPHATFPTGLSIICVAQKPR